MPIHPRSKYTLPTRSCCGSDATCTRSILPGVIDDVQPQLMSREIVAQTEMEVRERFISCSRLSAIPLSGGQYRQGDILANVAEKSAKSRPVLRIRRENRAPRPVIGRDVFFPSNEMRTAEASR